MLSPVYLGQAANVDLAFSGEEEAAQGCISAPMKICCICRYFSLRTLPKKALFEGGFGMQGAGG